MKRELLAATAIGSFAIVSSTSGFAQVFDWRGPYVGGILGYGFHGSRAVAFQPLGASTADLAFPNYVPTFNPAVPQAALSTGPFSFLPVGTLGAGGLIAGGTLGYNWQFDRFVLGLETDLAYFGTSNGGRSYQQDVTVNGVRSTSTSLSVGTDWLYTLRGRVGYAYERFLVFGTGGLALGRTHLTGAFGLNETNAAFTPDPFFLGKGTTTNTSALGAAFGSRNGVRTGYTLGGGVEYAITDNLTIKLEGLYYDLGTARAYLNGSGSYQASSVTTSPIIVLAALPGATTSSAGPFSIQPLAIRYRFDGAVARAGMNYKF